MIACGPRDYISAYSYLVSARHNICSISVPCPELCRHSSLMYQMSNVPCNYSILIKNSLFQIEKGDIAKSKGFPDTFTQDLGYDWELWSCAHPQRYRRCHWKMICGLASPGGQTRECPQIFSTCPRHLVSVAQVVSASISVAFYLRGLRCDLASVIVRRFDFYLRMEHSAVTPSSPLPRSKLFVTLDMLINE